MPGARAAAAPRPMQTLKWTDADFAEAADGPHADGQGAPRNGRSAISTPASRMPRSSLDETFVVQSTGHQPMETRSAMAYWQNGKLYLHCSTQSVVRTVDAVARWVGIEPTDVVLICEYTGGGFGSKGGGARVDGDSGAALEEGQRAGDDAHQPRGRTATSAARAPNMAGRAQVGLREGRPHHRARSLHRPGQRPVRADGRSSIRRQRRVADLSAGGDALARGQRPDQHAAAHAAAIAGADAGQRHHAKPVITKAAKQLGHRSGRDPPDEFARRQGALSARRMPRAARRHVTSAFVKEALDRGVEAVQLGRARRRAPAQRAGSKVRGVGVAVGPHGAGSIGYDGLMTIRPDGKLYVQSGVGNLGTHSVIDLARVAADVLDDAVGEGRSHLGRYRQAPAVDLPLGRQPDDARDDARQSRRRDGREAQAAGDRREGSRRLAGRLRRSATSACSASGNPSRGLDLRAGGDARDRARRQFDGHELPDDIHADDEGVGGRADAASGLMGVAKDNYPRDGDTYSFVVGFAEVEVDVETGKSSRWSTSLASATSARSSIRAACIAQINGGCCLGIAHALYQKLVYDPQLRRVARRGASTTTSR